MPADLVERSYNKMSYNFLQYTDIPTDNLDEWFFICATYNPMIQESGLILVLTPVLIHIHSLPMEVQTI